MKLERHAPPRDFVVGAQKTVLRDCGRLSLEPDEQVTLVRTSGAEFDVTAKSWGYYATPSTNGRMPSFGLRAALVFNRVTRRRFVLVVEDGFEEEFFSYLSAESMVVEAWLDRDLPEESNR